MKRPVFNLRHVKIMLLTYLLTPCSTVLLEKLTSFQPVKKFPAFYGTRRFITTFTSARHLSLLTVRVRVFLCEHRVTRYVFTVRSCEHNPHTSPIVGCPRLLIQNIRSYPPHWRPFLHLKPEDTPCRGGRDPLNTENNVNENILGTS